MNDSTTIIIACEVLRPELELLAKHLETAPETIFLEQNLHNYPDKLRAAVQGYVDDFERRHDGPLAIVFGYGLCGRALCGVRARRAVLIFPRLHDCIPLLMGLEQATANEAISARGGATYWMSPGWLESCLIELHIESHKRFAVYEQKFGAARAARLMKAENALLANYKSACHIRWPEMGDSYVRVARKVADATELPYTEVQGRTDYLHELLLGGKDQQRFLHLMPGQGIDMAVDGSIIAVNLDAAAGK